MTYRYFGGYGELAVVKTTTKQFKENLAQLVKLEHNIQTGQTTAYVQVAILDKRPLGSTGRLHEYTYCVCRAEVYPQLLTAEQFNCNKTMLKQLVADNLKQNYELLSMNGGSLWAA